MTDVTLGITLKADAAGLVGEVKLSADELKKLGKAAEQAGSNAGRSRSYWDRLRLSHERHRRAMEQQRREANLLRIAIIGLATGAGARLAGSFIDAASQTENLRSRLRFLTDDANAATDAVTGYAARVAFSFEDIQQATPVLFTVSKDVDEFNRLLEITGDIAAVTGLSFGETAQQIQRSLSAGINSADLFRERGVRSMLGFEAGVETSAKETRAHILGLWEDSTFALRGAAREQSGLWDGITSMIGDKWFKVRNILMDAGPFDFLKASGAEINEHLDRNFDEIGDSAELMGERIVAAMEAVVLGSAKFLDVVDAFNRAGKPIADFLNAGVDFGGTIREFFGGEDIARAVKDNPANAPGPHVAAAQDWLDRVRARMGQLRAASNEGGRAGGGGIGGTGGSTSGSLSQSERDALEERIRVDDEILGGMLGGEMPADGGMQAALAEQHKEAVEGLRDAYQELLPEYDRAVLEADRWKQETLAGLDRTSEGYDALAAQVEVVYQQKLKAAFDEHLEDSRSWSAGASEAFAEYADSATNAAENVKSVIGNAFSSAEDAIVDFRKTGEFEFGAFVDSVIDDMIRMQVRQQILGPISGALGGLDFGSIFAGIFHDGGVAGAAARGRMVDPAVFQGARRMHGGGMAGLGANEVPIIAERDEEILTRDDPRHRYNLGGGDSDVTVNVYNQTTGNGPATVTARERQSSGSRKEIDIFVRDSVQRAINGGQMDDTFAQNFGVSRAGTRR